MSAYIYCLYSTEDGIPRYVGDVDGKVSYKFKEHVTAALEKESGVLNDWIRDVWRRDFDVGVYTLQEGVTSSDVPLFKQYWIEQFATLLNVTQREPDRQHSPVGRQIIDALKAQLEAAKRRRP